MAVKTVNTVETLQAAVKGLNPANSRLVAAIRFRTRSLEISVCDWSPEVFPCRLQMYWLSLEKQSQQKWA
jgi:hypothetical protein